MSNGIAACEKTAMRQSVRITMRGFMVQCGSCNLVVLKGENEEHACLLLSQNRYFSTWGRCQPFMFFNFFNLIGFFYIIYVFLTVKKFK